MPFVKANLYYTRYLANQNIKVIRYVLNVFEDVTLLGRMKSNIGSGKLKEKTARLVKRESGRADSTLLYPLNEVQRDLASFCDRALVFFLLNT